MYLKNSDSNNSKGIQMETTQLQFFRYKGKRYTFKTPIIFEITETPDFIQEDEEDRGEYVIENEEWGIIGTDSRSLEHAVIDAEFYFHWDYGPYLESNNTDLELAKLMRKYPQLKKAELKEKRNEIIKSRKYTREKLLNIIETITDDNSAPWNDNEFFK